MQQMCFSDLPIAPEVYGENIFDRIKSEKYESEMTEGQRKFITGLIAYYQPSNVLEVGVSFGGGRVFF